MTTKQQEQALEYFRKNAEGWRSLAEGSVTNKVNIIEQRNGYVLMVADDQPALKTFLDVGCGTGELVCDAARRGMDATGVDYAAEMIDLASKKAQEEGVPQARFSCSSIFDFEMRKASYDLISANGFIEYISQQEMCAFFDRVAEALAPGGSFVVGSRNRLFNLVSMNEFTKQEMAAGHITPLLQETLLWAGSSSIAEVVNAECAPLQLPETEHADTGIKVTTRYQYTPLQLIKLLQERGLSAVEVYPVHVHCSTPSFCRTHADVHYLTANLLQTHARHNPQLLTNASTFMLHVKKER